MMLRIYKFHNLLLHMQVRLLSLYSKKRKQTLPPITTKMHTSEVPSTSEVSKNFAVDFSDSGIGPWVTDYMKITVLFTALCTVH